MTIKYNVWYWAESLAKTETIIVLFLFYSKTKEMWQLNTMYDTGLSGEEETIILFLCYSIFVEKDVNGTIGKMWRSVNWIVLC